MSLGSKAAIVGIGSTEFSKNSGRSEMQLAAEAVTAALADAGLAPSDVDGLCSFSMDNNSEGEVARTIGAGELRIFSRASYGGLGACVPVLQACMAVATGVANVVVCYRAMNERSEYRLGSAMAYNASDADAALMRLHTEHGLATAASLTAMVIRRYMHETGARSEDFGQVAVAARKHASTNPNAFFFGKPITLDDYMNSRMIADPFRLLDCCQESDGAVALVVTSAARAASLRQTPVLVAAVAQGAPRNIMPLTNYYNGDISDMRDVRFVADQLYAMSGLRPRDLQAAIIYDHFVPTVLPSLEAYGFCKRGQAKDFVKGGAVEVGGELPINTHGGQVGEAYIHGTNGIAEAVRQVRGAAVNQVHGLRNILVTAGSGGPTSGLILSAP